MLLLYRSSSAGAAVDCRCDLAPSSEIGRLSHGKAINSEAQGSRTQGRADPQAPSGRREGGAHAQAPRCRSESGSDPRSQEMTEREHEAMRLDTRLSRCRLLFANQQARSRHAGRAVGVRIQRVVIVSAVGIALANENHLVAHFLILRSISTVGSPCSLAKASRSFSSMRRCREPGIFQERMMPWSHHLRTRCAEKPNSLATSVVVTISTASPRKEGGLHHAQNISCCPWHCGQIPMCVQYTPSSSSSSALGSASTRVQSSRISESSSSLSNMIRMSPPSP